MPYTIHIDSKLALARSVGILSKDKAINGTKGSNRTKNSAVNYNYVQLTHCCLLYETNIL